MTANACGEMIPPFIDRILHIGAVPSGACRQQYAQRGRVWYLPSMPAAGSAALGNAEFDCMVIDLVTGRVDRRIDLAYLLQFLGPNGRISFVTRNGAEGDLLSELDLLLHPHGLLRFKTVHLQPEDGEAAAIRRCRGSLCLQPRRACGCACTEWTIPTCHSGPRGHPVRAAPHRRESGLCGRRKTEAISGLAAVTAGRSAIAQTLFQSSARVRTDHIGAAAPPSSVLPRGGVLAAHRQYCHGSAHVEIGSSCLARP